MAQEAAAGKRDEGHIVGMPGAKQLLQQVSGRWRCEDVAEGGSAETRDSDGPRQRCKRTAAEAKRGAIEGRRADSQHFGSARASEEAAQRRASRALLRCCTTQGSSRLTWPAAAGVGQLDCDCVALMVRRAARSLRRRAGA
jgi:hypothetical protein